ncbi:HutD family protein [Dokdonella sp.]|uniref:HutD/Ves family protein n=1 Tax=Dokdonella sp. TaxID=2291710 RepID=UPI001B2E9F70|nr:HutD family protein [Dokdonella sp.]MBO9663210.1 HutD family protein [Dokdonella sp.]
MRLIDASESRRVRWKNDGGWTTELARDPLGGEDFRWRVSIAEIESDGPFSAFPGVERDLILLDGEGIELDLGDAGTRRLTQRFERVHFAGEARVDCRLIAGPTRDFNVMARRDAVRAEVVARPLAGSMLVFAEPGEEWLIHVLAGHLEARRGDATLLAESGASLHLDLREAPDAGRVALDGAGELVLVKFVAAG